MCWGLNITLMTISFSYRDASSYNSFKSNICLLQNIFVNSRDSDSYIATDDACLCNMDNDTPQLFNKSEHSELIKDLGCCAEILGKN